MQMCVEEIMF